MQVFHSIACPTIVKKHIGCAHWLLLTVAKSEPICLGDQQYLPASQPTSNGCHLCVRARLLVTPPAMLLLGRSRQGHVQDLLNQRDIFLA